MPLIIERRVGERFSVIRHVKIGGRVLRGEEIEIRIIGRRGNSLKLSIQHPEDGYLVARPSKE